MPPDVRDVFVLATGVIPSDYPPTLLPSCRLALAELVEISWRALSDWSPAHSPTAAAASRKAKAKFLRDWRDIDPARLTELLTAAAELNRARLAELLTRLKARPEEVAEPATDAAGAG